MITTNWLVSLAGKRAGTSTPASLENTKSRRFYCYGKKLGNSLITGLVMNDFGLGHRNKATIKTDISGYGCRFRKEENLKRAVE